MAPKWSSLSFDMLQLCALKKPTAHHGRPLSSREWCHVLSCVLCLKSPPPPLHHLIITLRISLLQSNFSLFARLPAPQMSVEKHVISSVASTGLRRECLRPVACLPAPLWRRFFIRPVFIWLWSNWCLLYGHMPLSFIQFSFFAWSHYKVFSLSLPFPLSFSLSWSFSHIWEEMWLSFMSMRCVSPLSLSINYWAIKFTVPRGKSLAVNLSRRHSWVQVGWWNDGFAGDDIWIIQCWGSYFETVAC